MTREEWDSMPGCDQLRLIVGNMDRTREDFNCRRSLADLIKIFTAHVLSDVDVYPDNWTLRQVKEAIRGKPPRWDENERPIYD